MRGWLAAIGFGVIGLAPPLASAQIFASALPLARSVKSGYAASFFATISNNGAMTATHCAPGLGGQGEIGGTLHYQTTNASNQLTGAFDTPVSIPAGGRQTFAVYFTPNAIGEGAIGAVFKCDGQSAPITVGLNDLEVASDSAFLADIIPIALTPSLDGVLHIDGNGQRQTMVVAAVNIGPTAYVTVWPELDIPYAAPRLGASSAPAKVTLRQIDAQGQTVGVAYPAGQYMDVTFRQNEPVYFAVDVDSQTYGGLPFQPDTLRLKLNFWDDKIRGKTSVAVAAPAPASASASPLGVWAVCYTSSASTPAWTKTGLLIVGSADKAMFASNVYRANTDSNRQCDDYGYQFDYNFPVMSSVIAPLTVTAAGRQLSGFGPLNRTTVAPPDFGIPDGAMAMSGSFDPLSSIRLAYNVAGGPSSGRSGVISGYYSGLNGQQASASDLAGQWDVEQAENGGVPADGKASVASGVLTVNINNALLGAYSGCELSGPVTQLAGVTAIMSVQLTTSAACGPATFTGYAVKSGLSNPYGRALGRSRDYYLFFLTDPATNRQLRFNLAR